MIARTQLKRKFDWEIRFSRFIADSMSEKISLDWENFTCASWSADGIEEMTGVDLYADFREAGIVSPETAYRAIKKAGYDSLDQILGSQLPEQELAFVRRGDLVLGPPRLGSDLTAYSSCGIPHACGLAEPPFYWALSEEGLGRALISEAVKAFAVG